MQLLAHAKGNDSSPRLLNDVTIGQLIDRAAEKYDNRTALRGFYEADRTLTFVQLRNESTQLAAGLLATGIGAGDRLLLWGGNHVDLIVAVLACARIGVHFSLASATASPAALLQQLTTFNCDYKCVIGFATVAEGHVYQTLHGLCPDMQQQTKGFLKLAQLPTLSHVIVAENQKYPGCYSLSEVQQLATPKLTSRVADIQKSIHCHQAAALLFTMGTTGDPKGVLLSHFQLLNSCLVAGTQLCLDSPAQSLCCPLPVFRGPVLVLAAFGPLVFGCTTVLPAPMPVPVQLFHTIQQLECTVLLSNPAAFHLMLRLADTSKYNIRSLLKICLVGDHIPAELVSSLRRRAHNSHIVTGVMHSESGCMPIVWPTGGAPDRLLTRSHGTVAPHFEIKIVTHMHETVGRGELGELLIRPIAGTELLGYEGLDELKDNFYYDGWMLTGDAAVMDQDGFVSIVGQKNDLIINAKGETIVPWDIEKELRNHDQIFGAVVVGVPCGEHCKTAACVAVGSRLEAPNFEPDKTRKELALICKQAKVPAPDFIVFVAQLPRTANRRVQRYKMRQTICERVREAYPKENL